MEKINRYYENIHSEKYIYVFVGGPMTGKSILSRKICNAYIEDDFICTKENCRQLIVDIEREKPNNLIIITNKKQINQLTERLKYVIENCGYKISIKIS